MTRKRLLLAFTLTALLMTAGLPLRGQSSGTGALTGTLTGPCERPA